MPVVISKKIQKKFFLKTLTMNKSFFRDNSVIDDSVKSASIDLLEVIRDYNDVIIEANVTDEPSDDVSTTEVFDAAISLQMHYVHLTRHVVVLIGKEFMFKWLEKFCFVFSSK